MHDFLLKGSTYFDDFNVGKCELFSHVIQKCEILMTLIFLVIQILTGLKNSNFKVIQIFKI